MDIERDKMLKFLVTMAALILLLVGVATCQQNYYNEKGRDIESGYTR